MRDGVWLDKLRDALFVHEKIELGRCPFVFLESAPLFVLSKICCRERNCVCTGHICECIDDLNKFKATTLKKAQIDAASTTTGWI